MSESSARVIRSSSAGHPAPARHQVNTRVLWFAIFGAPAAWAVQTIANYGLVSHSCEPNDVPLTETAIPGTQAIAIAVSGVCVVVAIAALVLAVRSWRGTTHVEETERRAHELLEVGEGRARFMAFAGILTSVMFLFAVLMNAVPLFTRTLCR